MQLALQPISLVSASEDLMNHGAKIFEKKISRKFQKVKRIWQMLATISIAFILYLQLFT